MVLVWLAVLYHALIDFFNVPAAAGYFSKYAAEAIVGGFAFLSVIIIFALRRPQPGTFAEPVEGTHSPVLPTSSE